MACIHALSSKEAQALKLLNFYIFYSKGMQPIRLLLQAHTVYRSSSKDITIALKSCTETSLIVGVTLFNREC
jgi:hypothetical protein